ncbi:MAG: hypothetical protein DHS20C18_55500 [Saprospiraceae bacterium]|nr:MAG: hypothetical protein DHS20C18_55500 [Saprospiraceae bacterium]
MNPKDDTNDFIHQLAIEKFEWDNFDVSKIRPLEGLLEVGDNKVTD